MRCTNEDSQFITMDREDLAAWYQSTVGYDPTQDDPSITVEELREDCREIALIRRCGGLDSSAYRRVEAMRRRAGVVGGFYESYNETQPRSVVGTTAMLTQSALSA